MAWKNARKACEWLKSNTINFGHVFDNELCIYLKLSGSCMILMSFFDNIKVFSYFESAQNIIILTMMTAHMGSWDNNPTHSSFEQNSEPAEWWNSNWRPPQQAEIPILCCLAMKSSNLQVDSKVRHSASAVVIHFCLPYLSWHTLSDSISSKLCTLPTVHLSR